MHDVDEGSEVCSLGTRHGVLVPILLGSWLPSTD